MNNFDEKINPDELSSLTLAFLGDGVYEMLVREKLLLDGTRQIKRLHTLAVDCVRASSQAKAYDTVLPYLTEKEEVIIKRGRNSHVHHVPKNAERRDYQFATGIEALFGYLYIKGETERIRELFNIITNQDEEEEQAK